ncbi:sensor histidine kinase [Novosphingobium humi]|uniref:sensor histidine kinase n=1 Tax=Novosphingobium humi TaxID=2282397 RepID=UPI0025AFA4F7|nr:ATP-binding protein [Novosphingobium humi]WJT00729.1 ATP-binding protein [Novosphingobium humi]
MHPANHSRPMRWAIISLIAAGLAAALAHMLVRHRGMAQEMQTARTDLAMRKALITSEIARFRLLPIALADDRDVAAALAGNMAARDALNRKLEELVKTTGAPIIYVIAHDGKAIAASNWRSPQSFVGTDYSARRYVRDALAKGSASHFAMGTVSRRPGLYIAQRTPQGGVVAIKLEFDAVENAWARGDDATFVTEPNGIILVTSQPPWRFALTRPLSRAAQANFDAESMLPAAPARFAPFRMDEDGPRLDGKRMVLMSDALAQPGWTINLLRPVERVSLLAQGAALLAAAMVLAMTAVMWMWRERGRERMARTQELEQAVADRTADLRREMDERAALEARAADLREGLRQANRLASLGQITASVAHETAQPVAAIRTYADTSRMLLERGDNGTVHKNLAAIARLADRIGAVTSELRGFSRRSATDLSPVAIGEVIEGALLILKEQLKDISIALPHSTMAATCRVEGGRVRLEQVLVNLLQNAAQALCDVPSPAITVELRPTDEDVTLTITDNGPGIAEEVKRQLFTPFVTSRPDGLGLGLVISQDIMADAGGSLRHVDRPGATGACFAMTMRRAA